MIAQQHRELDTRLDATFDRLGLIGSTLRTELRHDLKAKLLLRAGADPVTVVGQGGVGKHKVAEVVHAVASDVLGRQGEMTRLDCGTVDPSSDPEQLLTALNEACGGTLLLDRFGTLDDAGQKRAAQIMREHEGDTLVVAVAEKPAKTSSATIRVKGLHDRQEDVWELIDHFFNACVEDHDLTAALEGCRGFSRQAKSDIAEVVRETNLSSVRTLDDIVRDVLFEALAAGPMPLKLTSDHVRPYLEAKFGQTPEARLDREVALLTSQLADTIESSLLERLSELHGVPQDVLVRQAEVVRDVIDSIEDVPRSYRNIMTRAEDVQRAAIWLVSGADTQASFRRFFGDEGFMRPTKSVAWAFYNRVFKRDM